MSKKYSKKKFKELLEQLVDENCHCNYCFLKRFMESLHPEPIVLVQLKCIDKFKWEKSEELDRELDWNEAGIFWEEEGWAKEFRKQFNEDLTIEEIYAKTKANIHP